MIPLTPVRSVIGAFFVTVTEHVHADTDQYQSKEKPVISKCLHGLFLQRPGAH